MKNNIVVFIAAILLFTSCEKITDDRSKPTPENPVIAWLLSVEIDRLPDGINVYSCEMYNTANPQYYYSFTGNVANLPELLKISGAQRLDQENWAITITGYNESVPEILVDAGNIPNMTDLQKFNYPYTMDFEWNNVVGKFFFRYD